MNKTTSLILVLLVTPFFAKAQNPKQFEKEIKRFAQIKIPENGEIAVFTGSSSIRFWEDLSVDCDASYAINTGFGGSQMSDLLFYLDETVLRFKPSKVYIYEGDNDIINLKSTKEILETTKEVVNKIKKQLPEVQLYIISAKPSPSRWAFQKQYLELNISFKNYCETKENLHFIDIWPTMLNAKGKPKGTLFIADSLHMNRKGYIIWKDVICRN
jgi:lysophospholipase L1-like esterase